MATINGTAGDDNLTGTDDADVINGLDGNDTIDGGYGADTLNGGAGNDTFMFGSARTSTFDYGQGVIDGGSGFDTLDWSRVTPSSITFVRNASGDNVLGGIVGSQKFEIRNVERIHLSAQNDFVSVTSVPSVTGLEIHMGDGNDYASVYGGNSVYAENGDDQIYIGGIGDPGIVDGGSGTDTLTTGGSFVVDLASGTAQSGGTKFQIANFEILEMYLNGYASSAFGDESSNIIRVVNALDDGSVGATFDGRGGDDYISGGNGNDTLSGGTGFDTVSYEYAKAAVRVDLGSNVATGGAGSDVLSGFEAVIGSAYSDTIIGDLNRNVLKGGSGDDTVIVMSGPKAIRPLGSHDIIEGGSGNDTAELSGFVSDYDLLAFGGKAYLVSSSNAIQLSEVENVSFFGAAPISLAEISSNAAPFASLSYIASYGDLRATFGADAARGAEHYINYGFSEGRNATFKALDYIASYRDLINAFGTDESAGARHFINYGANEGRATTFDGWKYLASHSDLIRAFGPNEEAAAQHYIQYGANEGRVASFDAAAYAAANADLREVLGDNAEALARHYVRFGYAEGRPLTSGLSVAGNDVLLSSEAQTASDGGLSLSAFTHNEAPESIVVAASWLGLSGEAPSLTHPEMLIFA